MRTALISRASFDTLLPDFSLLLDFTPGRDRPDFFDHALAVGVVGIVAIYGRVNRWAGNHLHTVANG